MKKTFLSIMLAMLAMYSAVAQAGGVVQTTWNGHALLGTSYWEPGAYGGVQNIFCGLYDVNPTTKNVTKVIYAQWHKENYWEFYWMSGLNDTSACTRWLMLKGIR